MSLFRRVLGFFLRTDSHCLRRGSISSSNVLRGLPYFVKTFSLVGRVHQPCLGKGRPNLIACLRSVNGITFRSSPKWVRVTEASFQRCLKNSSQTGPYEMTRLKRSLSSLLLSGPTRKYLNAHLQEDAPTGRPVMFF